MSTEQHEAILQHRRAAYSTNAQVDELVQSSSSSNADQGTVNSVEFPQFDHPNIIAKMTEFHTHMDSLQSAKCEVCLELNNAADGVLLISTCQSLFQVRIV